MRKVKNRLNRHPIVSDKFRLITRGKVKPLIKRSGIGRIFFGRDLYATTLSASWPRLMFSIALLYITLNAIFAELYLLQDGSIGNARPGSFSDAFFFSVQTLATIGYGSMNPATTYGNILVTFEALVGLSGLAIATGVIFSKISKPTARILFGNRALISPYKDVPCLTFRLGNLRNSPIAEPTIKAVLIIDEIGNDGVKRRIFHDLNLIRNNVPLLMPSWTARHQINKDSPLFGATSEVLRKKNIEVIISVMGFDETLSETVHSHHSYIADEITFGGKFVDIIRWDRKGRIHIDYTRFHEIR